jgi:hypothetical protein
MDHIVYLDHKARELENLRTGEKSMIIRGAMGRKLPHGRVSAGDSLFFIENKGDGLVRARAEVKDVFNSEKLSKQESEQIVEEKQNMLRLDSGLKKRFAGKRYLVLIEVETFQELTPFKIDRSDYGNMDDWLPVGDVERVRV